MGDPAIVASKRNSAPASLGQRKALMPRSNDHSATKAAKPRKPAANQNGTRSCTPSISNPSVRINTDHSGQKPRTIRSQTMPARVSKSGTRMDARMSFCSDFGSVMISPLWGVTDDESRYSHSGMVSREIISSKVGL